MNEQSPLIYFYIPQDKWPEPEWLESPYTYGQWQIVKGSNFIGQFDWTLQTYLHLKARNFPCKLIGTIPKEGIVLSHRVFLKDSIKPSEKLLLVCLQADSGRHPYAQLHIVQNPRQVTKEFSLWKSHFIPHWIQPNLIPRDSNRKDKFENVAFFGTKSNLAPELHDSSWEERLNKLGLRWQIKNTHEQWADFSDVDVVLAVRRFDPNSSYDWKPATKLYNAWHAGVPIILGRESAFRAERKSEYDYLEVTSVEETIAALKQLQTQPELRQEMIKNGRVRAVETTYEKLVERWCSLIENKIVPAYQRWCQTPRWQQQAFLKIRRSIDLKLQYLPNKSRQEYFAHVEKAKLMKQKGIF
jgi:glycosyltransferase involved in cell wall biosynthesis